jgi:hypothetical protein
MTHYWVNQLERHQMFYIRKTMHQAPCRLLPVNHNRLLFEIRGTDVTAPAPLGTSLTHRSSYAQ